ncbi:NAD(P)H-hydrate dehydratase [Amycolatopsis sp. NPDC004079]|uniref:ADP-dependent NAD(P)H-hydrate dehydratase n=1 Tax=Amycolatopsis sp. NPDC004079 TaxID=3154549 RepID=UPI0033B24D0A
MRGLAARAARCAEGGVKGDGGLVVVLGGSRVYGAPPFVAGLGARRVGAHGVWVAAPAGTAAQRAALDVHLIEAPGPELDAVTVEAAAAVSARLVRRLADTAARGRVVWLLGPGLGGSPQAEQVLDAAAEVRDGDRTAGLVVDGSLGGGPGARRLLRRLGPDVVLLNRHEARALMPATERPHGRDASIGAAALEELAREVGAAVVAKGDPDRIVTARRAWTVAAGHPGLARHGTGDVLAGVTAGLLAHALPAHGAAMLACHLVGSAGAALASDLGPGWLCGDLLAAVAAEFRDLLVPGR